MIILRDSCASVDKPASVTVALLHSATLHDPRPVLQRARLADYQALCCHPRLEILSVTDSAATSTALPSTPPSNMPSIVKTRPKQQEAATAQIADTAAPAWRRSSAVRLPWKQSRRTRRVKDYNLSVFVDELRRIISALSFRWVLVVTVEVA